MNTEPHIFDGQPVYFTTDARGMPGFEVRCSDCGAVLKVIAMDTTASLTTTEHQTHARSQAQEGR